MKALPFPELSASLQVSASADQPTIQSFGFFSQLVLLGGRNRLLSLIFPKCKVVARNRNDINKYAFEMKLLIQ